MLRIFVTAVAMVMLISGFVAATAQDTDVPTLGERLALLERTVASLETRFGLVEARAPAQQSGGGGELAFESQLAELRREIDRLNLSLARVERLAETAQREAAEARRAAMNAERSARDALSRAR